jgi:hypothetical protein
MPNTWTPFSYQNQLYDLSHLEPFEHVFVQAAREGKPERNYTVQIRFTHHCFTKGFEASDDPDLRYPSSKTDPRSFDVQRWRLSQRLPELVRDLMSMKVLHAGSRETYYTISMIDENGHRFEYEIYFELDKATDRRLHLTVASAFPRDLTRLASRPKHRPIKFEVLLYNVQMGKQTRMQP